MFERLNAFYWSGDRPWKVENVEVPNDQHRVVRVVFSCQNLGVGILIDSRGRGFKCDSADWYYGRTLISLHHFVHFAYISCPVSVSSVSDEACGTGFAVGRNRGTMLIPLVVGGLVFPLSSELPLASDSERMVIPPPIVELMVVGGEDQVVS